VYSLNAQLFARSDVMVFVSCYASLLLFLVNIPVFMPICFALVTVCRCSYCILLIFTVFEALYCPVLLCILYCAVLPCIALYSVLRCIALYCSVWLCIALYCSVFCIALYCSLLLTERYTFDHIKNNEIGGACTTYGGQE